jgi:hypothetical protein
MLLGAPHWIIAFIYPKCSLNNPKSDSCNLSSLISHNHFEGLYSSYAGYITISDHSGQIRFPLQHESSALFVLVTQKIVPVFSEKKTISHFEIDPTSAGELYKLTQSEDKTHWQTTQEKLPDHGIISPYTLILFAKPDQVMLELGKQTTHKSNQLLLPKFFISDTIKNEFNSFQVLTIRQFFSPLRPLYKQGEQELSTNLSY